MDSTYRLWALHAVDGLYILFVALLTEVYGLYDVHTDIYELYKRVLVVFQSDG